MTSTRRVRVADIGDGLIGVWADFDFKDDLKSMPGSRWDSRRRCWVMPSAWQREVEELLGLGPPRRASSRPSRPLADAVALLLLALPSELRRSAFRALVRVVHPDQGGNDETARELLTGAERAGLR
jgi:hypothetical protein